MHETLRVPQEMVRDLTPEPAQPAPEADETPAEHEPLSQHEATVEPVPEEVTAE